MSQVIQISDDAYRILETLAQREGQTPAQLVESWAADHAPPQAEKEHHYYTTEEWFRHLGVSEEHIQQALKEAHEDVGEYDADA